mmetsp:Transcript_55280/g.131300  ORF Transcript_55280/g.131300 Transcript_55280/m.131300 type:complete len:243 (+) Transcript_55280:323-1051(+)
MQPMTAMVTPGRCPVASEIFAVTSWRSKRVRPQEGHETYSVLMLRIREPWRRPKDVRRTNSRSSGDSIRTPSPLPSTSEHPTWEPVVRTSSSRGSVVNLVWWITGILDASAFMASNTRRDAWMREMSAGTSSRIITASDDATALRSSSDSSPRTVTAIRTAPSGILAPAISARGTTATASGRGFAVSSAIGARTPTPTSWRRRSARRRSLSAAAGNVRMKTESDVAMSLNGKPTAVLHPSFA